VRGDRTNRHRRVEFPQPAGPGPVLTVARSRVGSGDVKRALARRGAPGGVNCRKQHRTREMVDRGPGGVAENTMSW